MSKPTSFWKTLSPRSFFLFLLGVFFVFSAVGFASDVADLGRTPKLRFVLSILISGIFPVFYAFGGFALRKHFWKAFVPVFAIHFYVMNVLSASLPSPRQATQMDAADIARLHSRLSFDGFYIGSDGKMMVALVTTGANFDASTPAALFQAGARPAISSNDTFDYDVSRDGQRFLIITQAKTGESQPISVIVNWSARLNK